jgi:hypothetical protein
MRITHSRLSGVVDTSWTHGDKLDREDEMHGAAWSGRIQAGVVWFPAKHSAKILRS